MIARAKELMQNPDVRSNKYYDCVLYFTNLNWKEETQEMPVCNTANNTSFATHHTGKPHMIIGLHHFVEVNGTSRHAFGNLPTTSIFYHLSVKIGKLYNRSITESCLMFDAFPIHFLKSMAG